MRLDPQEKSAINKALQGIAAQAVYLFGSRADDDKKGGDIDILIFSKEDPFELSRRIAVQFFMACEEKIDVVVLDPDRLSPEQEAFLNLVRQTRMERLI